MKEKITHFFSKQSLSQLALLLKQEGHISIAEFHGYITGHASISGEIFTDRMIRNFLDSDFSLKMSDSMRDLFSLIIRFSNHTMIKLYAGKLEPLLSVEEDNHQLSESQSKQGMRDWLNGYINGLGKDYRHYLDDHAKPSIQLRFLEILTIIFFDKCTDILPDLNSIATENNKLRQQVTNKLPATVFAIYSDFLEYRHAHHRAYFEAKIIADKNERCPCGSGRLFKQCCLQ